MKFSRLDALVLKIRIERIARIVTVKHGEIEVWDLGSHEFALEAWSLMTFGGVHVGT